MHAACSHSCQFHGPSHTDGICSEWHWAQQLPCCGGALALMWNPGCHWESHYCIVSFLATHLSLLIHITPHHIPIYNSIYLICLHPTSCCHPDLQVSIPPLVSFGPELDCGTTIFQENEVNTMRSRTCCKWWIFSLLHNIFSFLHQEFTGWVNPALPNWTWTPYFNLHHLPFFSA